MALAQLESSECTKYTTIQPLEDQRKSTDSEIVIGLVGAVGTDLDKVATVISDRLKKYVYKTHIIIVSKTILCNIFNVGEIADEFNRINKYMDLGNKLRSKIHQGILAEGVANTIHDLRLAEGKQPILKRTAFIVKSLKNEAEVRFLREIYGNGFYLISVYTDEDTRSTNLNAKIFDKQNVKKGSVRHWFMLLGSD